MMAGTCIGVFLLVIMLEFVRRAGREYDALILRQFKDHVKNQAANSEADTNGDTAVFRASPVQQFVRSIIRKFSSQQVARLRDCPLRSYHVMSLLISRRAQANKNSATDAAAFAIAYILMLIAMSYNGYVIIMIILGAGFGKFLADWAPKKVLVGDNTVTQAKDLNKCDEDATMCCG
jgi:solute carrier family 31 (copper transporter), member 1